MAGDRLLRGLARAGGWILLVGLVRAFIERDYGSPVLAIVVLAAGTALTIGAPAVSLLRTRSGLALGALATGCAAAGAVDLMAGPLVTGWLGVTGVLLLAAALLAYGRLLRATDSDLAVARAARSLETFGAAHGGIAGIAIERLGGWHRLVAVAGDGAFGDVVVRTPDQARAAAQLAGVEPLEPTDPTLFGSLRTGPYEWRRMAGAQL